MSATPESHWSKEELATLRGCYHTGTHAEIIAALPGRSWLAIKRAASKIKVTRPTAARHIKWTAAELKTLHKLYSTKGAEATLAAMPRFTVQAIRQQAAKLGIRAYRAPATYLLRKQEKKEALRAERAAVKQQREAIARQVRLDRMLENNQRTAAKATLLATQAATKAAKAAAKQAKEAAKALKAVAPATRPVATEPAVRTPGLHIQMPPDSAKHRPEPAKSLPPMQVKPANQHPTLPSVRTPVANARLAAKKNALPVKPAGYVSADQIRALGPTHPARLAYTVAAHKGMPAAQQAYHEAMRTYNQGTKQAA